MLDIVNFVSGGVAKILGASVTITGDVVLNILTSVFSALPNGSGFPTYVHTGAIYLGSALHKVAFIVPVPDLINCILAIISLKIFLFVFHIAYMVFNWIRGVSTPAFDGGMLPSESAYSASSRARSMFD